jgi:hypothetical protein
LAFFAAGQRQVRHKNVFRNFFAPIVNWITYARAIPAHCVFHRMAQANFNIRGWQGR